MVKKKIIIGNWKMNPETGAIARGWFVRIARSLPRLKQTEIVICPPFIYLEQLHNISRKVLLGGQDAAPGQTGPLTGEVSTEMLYNTGARFVILGHSERRALGESNNLINKKIKSALVSALIPIVCVGEKDRDDEHGYFNVVREQIRECLKHIPKASLSRIIIAYEPIWAISSTKGRRDATPDDFREMAMFIKKVLSDLSSPEVASRTRIIYGGSVTERDAADFVRNGGADGVLVGKASLTPNKFLEIVKKCEALKS